MRELTDKDVLITGGCGSIGSAMVARVLDRDPRSIRILDTNEQGLFELQRRFKEHRDSLRFLLGDIRDRDRLEMALEDIDVVFHAAALKHVELNEYNPFEAVQTNVQGTQNLIRKCLDEDVDAFVGISTDKASNPISVMGATKLLSERLIIAANAYKGKRETGFSCVRFGNVLGSSGSVVPIFSEQIRQGGPITVTDPEMTRFIMPVEEAVDLVLDVYNRMVGGEVFVLKMPAFQIGDLAEAIREAYTPTVGADPANIDIERIGARPGERIHEKLIAKDELAHTRELERMFVIYPQIDLKDYEGLDEGGNHSLEGEYTSADASKLTKREIIELLNETKSIFEATS